MTRLRGATIFTLTALTAFFICVLSYSYADEKRYVVPLGDSPSCGPQNAPVTIIEFLDYQ